MANITEIIQSILQTDQLTSEIIASAIIFSIIAVVGWTVYFVFSRYLVAWAGKTKSTLDDDILKNVKPITILIVLIAGFYYSLSSLSSLQPYTVQLSKIFSVLGILIGAFMVTKIASILINWYGSRISRKNVNNNHILFLLKKIVQLIVYILAFLIILWVLGIDLSGVVVGLGVGGIAIAFALQSTLSDFFSAFSIYFDRPFEIGDFIVVGDHSGTVTNIGIKSTRIQLLQGEELVVPNKELTSTNVRNFKKLKRRRITFTIGVRYNTPVDKLKKIPQIITNIIENIELAELFLVRFTEFGEFSLRFTIIYYVKVADYTKYLETQEKINFAIKEAFEKEGIEFAFPTKTVYLQK
ncbi:MAG: mechanosensitive ion channel family protein [Candidatus Bathyarchaeota archaeon]|nr:mechanosensitive ion channel family protein [Candidatus Bathyarchaeota archaeon]